MAMLLKRKFELLALQASLRPEAGIQKVHFKLEYFARDDDALLGAWTVDAASLQTGPLRDLLAETLGLPASSAGQSEGLIDVAGLEVEALYGGFRREPFDEDSLEFVFVARKPA